MALQKTIEVMGIRYTAETKRDLGHPMDEPHALWVDTMMIIDDPEDPNNPHFPVKNTNMYRLYQDSDVSGEPQIVQDIWNVVFVKNAMTSDVSIPKIGPDATFYNRPVTTSTNTVTNVTPGA
jgi:hypothetical protein